jgi:TPR repeat protein
MCKKVFFSFLVSLAFVFQAGADEAPATIIDENTPPEILLPLAEGGDGNAQYFLAVHFLMGNNIEQDIAQAFRWLSKSAEQGVPDAQWNLGTCYQDGIGVDVDLQEAVRWYRKAAEQGLAGAQNDLGVCYQHGVGVPVNSTEAVRWYRKAAEQGIAIAQNNLGICYYHGFGVTKDVLEAVRWLQRAAEQGYADAQFNLGVIYDTGCLGQRFPAAAQELFQKAAEQGHVEAQRIVNLIPPPPPHPAAIFLPLTVIVLLAIGFIYLLLYQRPCITDGMQLAHNKTVSEQSIELYRNIASTRTIAIYNLFISLAFIALALFCCAFVPGDVDSHPITMIVGLALLITAICQLLFLFSILRLCLLQNAGCGCVIAYLGGLIIPLLFPIFALVILVRSGKTLHEAGYTIGVFQTDMEQFHEPVEQFSNPNQNL